MKKLILASQSPRRKQILHDAGYSFLIIPSDKDETADKNLPVDKYVEKLSFNKAFDIFSVNQDAVVIGADTLVHIDGKILGKPANHEEAIKTLKFLSGKTHKVTTGYTIMDNNKTITGHVTTEVVFNELQDELIKEYVNSGYSDGKAGSYGIQDPYPIVKEYTGSYLNVVGLPIEKIKEILNDYFEI